MIAGWIPTDSAKRNKWLLRRLKKVKIWQLLVLGVIFAVLAMVFLRLSNLNMANLRQAVYTADRAADTVKLDQAVTNLQRYVRAHMNTDTGRISLQTKYDNAVRAAFADANQHINNINNDAYNAAIDGCKPQINTGGYPAFAACVADAVGVDGSKFSEPVLPPAALFQISFAAPKLSFDLAGVTLIICFLIFLVAIIRIITEVILRIVVKKSKTLT